MKAYYPDGAVDVFDTDHFTEALPMRGNLLTNYVLDWSGAGRGEGIWMRVYWHESSDAYRDVADSHGLPVARRRDGWSFLVADAGDVAVLERLTLDGETVLGRVAGVLVDVARLMHAYDEAEDFGPRAVAVHGYLDALMGDSGSGDHEDLVCHEMGMSKESYREVEDVQVCIARQGSRAGDEWAE